MSSDGFPGWFFAGEGGATFEYLFCPNLPALLWSRPFSFPVLTTFGERMETTECAPTQEQKGSGFQEALLPCLRSLPL